MAIKVRSNGQWLPVSGGGGEPVGTILMWAGTSSTIPSGFLLCDGSAISRTTYSALFAAIGTTNGAGDGSSTFNLPDLRDKFVVGATASTGDTSYPNVSPAATGGSADATVIAQHNHTLPKISLNPGNDSTVAITLGSGQSYQIGYHQTSMSSKTTGDTTGGSATNGNLPPYYALCYLVKVYNTRATAINSTPGPPGPPGPASTVAGPPGPSGSAGITVKDQGTALSTQASSLDFVGYGIIATGTGADKTITVPTPAVVASNETNHTVSSSSYNTFKTVNITPTTSGTSLLVVVNGDAVSAEDVDNSVKNCQVKLMRTATPAPGGSPVTVQQGGTITSTRGGRTLNIISKDNPYHGGNQVTYFLQARTTGGGDDDPLFRASMFIWEIV